MKKRILYSCLFLLCSSVAIAQIAINGAVCTVTGGSNGNVYMLSGSNQQTDNITWVIQGGVIAGSTDTTASGTIASIGSSLRIVWNTGFNTGHIQVTNSRLGTASLTVNLQTVDNTISAVNQLVSSGATISITGGNFSGPVCTAVYAFWWETADSSNGPFNAIEGATGKDFSFSNATHPAYYAGCYW